MRKKEVAYLLEKALKHSEDLIARSKGDLNSPCSVERYEEIEIYLQSWVMSYIRNALKEVKR